MDDQPAILAYLMAAGLVGLAAYYSWQQVTALRKLRSQPELPALDRSYTRRQAWLRLGCCALMVLLAVLIAGAYASGLEDEARALGQAARNRAEGEGPTLEQKRFLQIYSSYWNSILLILLVLVILAGLDVWSIQSYGRRRMQQLEEARQDLIDRQAALFRTQRNGHPHS